MVGSRMPIAVHEPAPGVVGQQQLADGLLGAVAGQRGEVVVVRDRCGQRRTVDRDRGGEHQPGPVAVGGVPGADRLQQVAGAVQVDPVALVEVGLGLPGHHRGQVDRSRPAGRPPRPRRRPDRRGRRGGVHGSRSSRPAGRVRSRRAASGGRGRRRRADRRRPAGRVSLRPSIPAAPMIATCMGPPRPRTAGDVLAHGGRSARSRPGGRGRAATRRRRRGGPSWPGWSAGPAPPGSCRATPGPWVTNRRNVARGAPGQRQGQGLVPGAHPVALLGHVGDHGPAEGARRATSARPRPARSRCVCTARSASR